MTKKPGPYTEEDKRNWEVEKLQAEYRNLGRSFWTALMIALFAILGTLANIYFNQNQKVLSEIQKERLDQEAKALEAETKTLKEERDKLQADKTRISQELLALAQQSDAEKRKQLEKLATDIRTISVTSATPTTNLPARVYLQFLRSQESKVTPIIEELRKRGYLVFPKAVDSSARRREIFVGYYYDTDRTEAEALLKALQELGATSSTQQPEFIKGGARPRHYDVWLAFPDA